MAENLLTKLRVRIFSYRWANLWPWVEKNVFNSTHSQQRWDISTLTLHCNKNEFRCYRNLKSHSVQTRKHITISTFSALHVLTIDTQKSQCSTQIVIPFHSWANDWTFKHEHWKHCCEDFPLHHVNFSLQLFAMRVHGGKYEQLHLWATESSTAAAEVNTDAARATGERFAAITYH